MTQVEGEGTGRADACSAPLPPGLGSGSDPWWGEGLLPMILSVWGCFQTRGPRDDCSRRDVRVKAK